ncbi:MAG TPA: cystathionine gamma-lyase [Thermoleophilaceae bacterium]|nr:cystathionine gamma-lyase [Thermoleophilaceae bacterium]
MSDQSQAPGPSTRAVHAGLPAPSQGAPMLPGPVFAAPYHLAGDPSASPYGYARYANPTCEALEAAVGSLEDGRAAAFSSGMAAVTAVLVGSLMPGDVLAVSRDGYPTVRALAAGHLEPRGVELRLFGPGEDPPVEGATLTWVESPANPGLDVYDIAGIAGAVHAAGGRLAVDNTLATPLGQRPLDLGADISVTSGSKALTGHADLLMGFVTTREEAVADGVRAWRNQTGAVPGPFEAWLAHRSIGTLALRLDRQCATALALAQWLTESDSVSAVRYPGLPGDPAHDLAARQMRRFGPVVALDLGTRERAERFLARCRLVIEATSFGGLHTTAERRARWGHGDEVGEGFIRFSCGCEETADVLADVEQALATT